MRSTTYWILLAAVLGAGRDVLAQGHVSVATDVVFYGDNTEFHGPFREGETLLGAAGRIAASIAVNDRVNVTLGLFGNHRFGGGGFDRAVPVAALSVAGRRSSFIFGTLPTVTGPKPVGADRQGPHGLLPPLQRDNLAIERPYEAGLQWTWRASRIRHDAWLNWQRLNTEEHRERFDTGLSGRAVLARAVSAGFQMHVVHEGGQRFASGPVADSAAYAAGLIVEHRLGPFDIVSVEGWGLLGRYVPDRQTPARSMTGEGMLVRLAGERAGWRGHVIVWRGRDFVKDEGDANYLSMRLDGTRYHGTRDYSEVGLARRFRPAPEVVVEASARVHRVEKNFDYSFRIVANANLKWRY
jgi:hypothetical protein